MGEDDDKYTSDLGHRAARSNQLFRWVKGEIEIPLAEWSLGGACCHSIRIYRGQRN